MNNLFKLSENPKWTLPHCALLLLVCSAAIIEYLTGSTLVVGNNISVSMLVLSFFVATFMPSRTWLLQFTSATSLIIIALWLAKTADLKYSIEAGFLLLLTLWASVGISLILRRQLEQTHSQSALMDELNLSSILLSSDLTIAWSNDALDRTLQKPSGTCLGKPFLTLIKREDREKVEQLFASLDRRSIAKFDTQMMRSDKTFVPVQISIAASNNQFEVLCLTLSKIRDTESALRQTQELLAQQLQNTPLIHMHWTSDGHIQGWNKTAEKYLGYTEAEALGMHLTDFVEKRVMDGARQRLEATLGTSGGDSGVTRVLHKDGTVRFLRYHNNLVKDDAGDLTGIHGLSEDVTEEFRLRKAMSASQEKFASVFHNCPDGLVLIRLSDRKIIDANDTYQNLLQLQEESVNSSAFIDSWKPLDNFDSFSRSLDQREELSYFETKLLMKQGNALPVFLSTSFFELNNEDCLLIIIRDATESKRTEEERSQLQGQLVQAQKMDSIGQLAGGVAHDFNNMIGAIQGFAELIRDKTDKDDRRHHYAGQIVISATRAADLTSNLLDFSRSTNMEPVSLNLVNIVTNTLAIFVQAIDPLINVKFLHDRDEYTVSADTSHLEAVLLNLLINARDAIPGRGTLTIQLELIRLTEIESQKIDPELAAGNYARLSVKDTGIGIPQEIQEKIVLPFFTTKEVGEGTGLGLSSVYGTVKSHDGAMTIASSTGKGTTISLFFPSTDETHEPTESTETPLIAGVGKILIIDDEEQMRMMTQAILEEAGYSTLLAENGAEGVRLYANHQQDIDLVVLDLVMPIMNGTDTLQALKTLEDKVKVLIMTGYTSEQHRELIAQGAMGILSKPFTRSLLCQQVDAAIKTIRLSERKNRPNKDLW